MEEKDFKLNDLVISKKKLIEELLHEPLSFDDRKLDDLLNMGFNFSDIRECIRRIYDLSESQLSETSNANRGMMGLLNRLSTGRRKSVFNKKIKKIRKGDEHKLIYAEGDSWFQFPVFITDIIDWLNRNRKYIIYSDASGGDWITNIIYESQYVPALSLLRPGYFLISGGGNDLVGDNRLAIMVKRGSNYPKYTTEHPPDDPDLTSYHLSEIMKVQEHITKEFYAFLLTIKAQYLLLFRGIYREKSTVKDIITITQGYDYAIPSFSRKFSFRYPLKMVINYALDSGCWLKRPLMIRGIVEEDLQRALVMTFIYEFNRIFINIAERQEFKNVYHIDCRNLAFSKKCWYDELHYKGYVFRIAAMAYSHIIENHGKCEKVVKASDFRKKPSHPVDNQHNVTLNLPSKMYYLVINIMNDERCIAKSSEDQFEDGAHLTCEKHLSYNKTRLVKRIRISCIENPENLINAVVYSD